MTQPLSLVLAVVVTPPLAAAVASGVMVTGMPAWPEPVRPLMSTARLPKSPIVPLGVARRLFVVTAWAVPMLSHVTEEVIFRNLGASSSDAQLSEPAVPARYSPLERT